MHDINSMKIIMKRIIIQLISILKLIQKIIKRAFGYFLFVKELQLTEHFHYKWIEYLLV
jgi:hypothetical protein